MNTYSLTLHEASAKLAAPLRDQAKSRLMLVVRRRSAFALLLSAGRRRSLAPPRPAFSSTSAPTAPTLPG